PFDAWIYAPKHREPIGAYLLCPGIHYDGPADARFERFASILAAAGIVVLAPFLPDFLQLRVDPRVVGDLDRAFSALLDANERPRGSKPGLFSISFGSLPVLRVASSMERRDQVGAVMVFGGYADFANAMTFSLEGPARDPTNQPVVFMNLIDDLE